MVGEHHDEGLVLPTGLAERVEHAAELGVGEGHLAIVGIREASAIRLGRCVGEVRIVEMHPREKRLVPCDMRPQPRHSCIGHGACGPLGHRPGRGLRQPLVEGVEAATEPEGRRYGVRRHEGSRPPA